MFALTLPGSLTQLCLGRHRRVRAEWVSGCFLKRGAIFQAQDLSAQDVSSYSEEDSGSVEGQRAALVAVEGGKEEREDWAVPEPQR